MATPTPSPTPSATPPKEVTTPSAITAAQWKEAEDYLAAVKEKIFSYSGKPGFNPHVWWRDESRECHLLEKRLADGKKSPDLYASIMALSFSEPVVKTYGMSGGKEGKT